LHVLLAKHLGFGKETLHVIEPVPRIGAGDCRRPWVVSTLQLPLADRLAHERRTAILFERVLHAEQHTLANAWESEAGRPWWPCVLILSDQAESATPRQPWQLWPAHPAFTDEIKRWWPSDEYPPPTPDVVVEDHWPDRLPDVVLMPARGGLLDVWI
jgi:hypothetical protein